MFRFVFLFIVVIHGLIHLLGFVKAFELATVEQLTKNISKPFGLLWLLTSLVLLSTAFLYFAKKDWWWQIAWLSVVLSQLLIFFFWKDAKFGTLANIVILLVCIVAYANFKFTQTTQTEISHILSKIDPNAAVITNEMIKDLPTPVQKWLRNSEVIGKTDIYSVHLKQNILMKLKPGQSNWTKAIAEQYFTTQEPAFIWTVKMQTMQLVEIVGRDKFEEGKGEMLIKIFSLFPVVQSKANDKLNTATLQRYLAEIVWFPSVALSPFISWEKIDDFSAKATMDYKGTKGSGIFYFDENGTFKKFTAMRFMDGEADAQLKEWIIEVSESKVVNGIKIPTKMNATWKLDDKDWTWLQIELVEITHNL